MIVATEKGPEPQSARRPGRLVAWVLAPSLILVLSVLLFGLFAFPIGMRPIEYIDLLYSQYASTVGIEGFNPTGARLISFKKFTSIDSSDCWWKLTISASQYEALRQAEDHDSVVGESARPVRKTTSDDSRVPPHWPSPDATPPSWWRPPSTGPGVECTRWESQLSGRGVGRYWVYDRRTATLWIWRWNHQWFRFEGFQDDG